MVGVTRSCGVVFGASLEKIFPARMSEDASLERKRGPKKHMDVCSVNGRLTSAAAAVGDISCHDDSVGYATRVKILNTEIVGTFRERADR
jgi:hypothetical protein